MQKGVSSGADAFVILNFLKIIDLFSEYQIARGKPANFQELFLEWNERVAAKR
jgi:hypothetical protein